MPKTFLMLLMLFVVSGLTACHQKPSPNLSACPENLSRQHYQFTSLDLTGRMVVGYVTGKDLLEFWEVWMSVAEGKPVLKNVSLGQPCLDQQGNRFFYNAKSSKGLLYLDRFNRFLWLKRETAEELLLPSTDPAAQALRLGLEGEFYLSKEARDLGSQLGL